MADDYVERVAGELADLALADEVRMDDIQIVDQIATMIGASSQILEEAYNTAVRVRRAERQARELLHKRAGKKAVPLAHVIEDHSQDFDGADVEDAQELDDALPIFMQAEPDLKQSPVLDVVETAPAPKAEPEPAPEPEPEPTPAPEEDVAEEAPAPKPKKKKTKKKISGPWDLEEGAEEDEDEDDDEDEEEQAQEPAAPTVPRRVKR